VLTIQFFKPGTGTDANDNITAANQRLVDSVSFTDNHLGGTYDWTVYNSIDGTHESGSISMAAGAAFTIDPTLDFDTIVMTGTAGSMRPNNMSFTEKLLPDGETLHFQVTGTDGDGDQVTDPVTITILPGEAPDAALASFSALDVVQDSGSDPAVQYATADADTLLATDGEDVFAWSLADHTVAGDTVIGFDQTADAINIADILDSSVDRGDFSSYLEVGLADDGASTVLRVSSAGDFANADQTITLQDVNLLDGVNLDDSAALHAALQHLVDAGKLITD
jgi:hypothetical protein